MMPKQGVLNMKIIDNVEARENSMMQIEIDWSSLFSLLIIESSIPVFVMQSAFRC